MRNGLAKPKFGSPCNGCGICCQLQRCHYSVLIFGDGPGPCPALEDDGERTWCGILRNPMSYADEPIYRLPAKQIGEFQAAFASALAIGSGCDSSDEAVAAVIARSAQT
jgi:hypothetical protein